MPVIFKTCNTNICTETQEQELNEFVETLNSKFAERSCVCHPDKIWDFGVDFKEDFKYRIHEGAYKEYTCDFEKKLLAEINGSI